MGSVQLVIDSVPDLVSSLFFVGTRAHRLVHPHAVSVLFVAALSDTEVFLFLGVPLLINSRFVADVLVSL